MTACPLDCLFLLPRLVHAFDHAQDEFDVFGFDFLGSFEEVAVGRIFKQELGKVAGFRRGVAEVRRLRHGSGQEVVDGDMEIVGDLLDTFRARHAAFSGITDGIVAESQLAQDYGLKCDASCIAK